MQILLTLAYDGTNYAGWQRQQNAVAVQEKVEDALAGIYSGGVTVHGASRTDAGVHALGQRASFFVPPNSDAKKIPLEKLPQVINGHLPQDIAVQAAQAVPDDFNPQFNAVRKTYIYNFYTSPLPSPLLARYNAHVPQALSLQDMQTAARAFVGEHDFAAFCATGSTVKTTTRIVYDCGVSEQADNIFALKITGNGFLYNMVRIITGTVIYAGMGKLPADGIPEIIAKKDRASAGKTMPPHGLLLCSVEY